MYRDFAYPIVLLADLTLSVRKGSETYLRSCHRQPPLRHKIVTGLQGKDQSGSSLRFDLVSSIPLQRMSYKVKLYQFCGPSTVYYGSRSGNSCLKFNDSN